MLEFIGVNLIAETFFSKITDGNEARDPVSIDQNIIEDNLASVSNSKENPDLDSKKLKAAVELQHVLEESLSEIKIDSTASCCKSQDATPLQATNI